MKRTVLTMLALFLILMGASAQGNVKNVQAKKNQKTAASKAIITRI